MEHPRTASEVVRQGPGGAGMQRLAQAKVGVAGGACEAGALLHGQGANLGRRDLGWIEVHAEHRVLAALHMRFGDPGP